MKNLMLIEKSYNINTDNLSKHLAAIVIFSATLSILFYVDVNYKNNSFAQTVLDSCLPDRGIKTAQSNCFSNSPTSPVYNANSTQNVRPPEENPSIYYNYSNPNLNLSSNQ